MTFQSVTSSNVIGIAGILVCVVVRLPTGLPPAPWCCILYSFKCENSKKIFYLVTCTWMMDGRNISLKMYSGAKSSSIWIASPWSCHMTGGCFSAHLHHFLILPVEYSSLSYWNERLMTQVTLVREKSHAVEVVPNSICQAVKPCQMTPGLIL